MNCLKCPYGAECPGGNLKSKSNFWGYKFEKNIVFQQCPLGYCCAGSDSCIGYDDCLGNRDSTLCGACKHGYSASILSAECVPDIECGAYWIWPVAILAVTAYMLWYTFKDDILGIPWLLYHTCCKKKESSQTSDSDDVDKGYFGIMTYFVQAAAMMRLSLELGTVDNITNIVQEIEKYIGLILSIELTYISYNLCLFEKSSTTEKLLFKLLFLVGIYISWGIIYFVLFVICKLIKCTIKRERVTFFTEIKLRFIKGLVEIIKYTYGGFTGIVFMSLTCVSVASDKVWYYDGTVSCLSDWQISMVALCIIYILPSPFMLIIGMKLLETNRISSAHFLCGCIVPLPFLLFWLIMNCTSKTPKVGDRANGKNDVSSMAREILDSFQGTYVNTNGAKYWESVMISRRLLLGATALLPNTIIQMASCFFLNQMFLIHHFCVKPFQYIISNTIESISLVLLTLISVISLSKSYYIQTGVNPDGPNVNYFKSLRLIESSLILLLICFIIIFEIRV